MVIVIARIIPNTCMHVAVTINKKSCYGRIIIIRKLKNNTAEGSDNLVSE